MYDTKQKDALYLKELYTEENFARHYIGAGTELLKAIMNCVTTDGAVAVLRDAGITDPVMEILMKKISCYLNRRVYDGIRIGAVVFSNVYGVLGRTDAVPELLARIREEQDRPKGGNRD